MNNTLRKTISFMLAGAMTAASLGTAGSAEGAAQAEAEVSAADIRETIDRKIAAARSASDGVTPFMVELTDEEREYIHNSVSRSADAFSAPINLSGSMSVYANDYFYDQMTAAEKTLYSNLYNVCAQFAASSTDLSDEFTETWAAYDSDALSKDQVNLVYQLFYFSNPQFYFLQNGFIFESGKVYPNIYADFEDHTVRNEYSSKISSVADEWLAEINAADTELAKQKIIYNDLCKTVTYNLSAKLNQSIASVFVNGESVCNGYALSTEYLCNAAGIDCIVAVGQGHAWNIISLDGVWYSFDVTWMDTDKNGVINLKWRNKSHDTFLENDDANNSHSYRTVLYTSYALPECNVDMMLEDDYFSVDSTGLLYEYNGSQTDIVIPDDIGINAVHAQAFYKKPEITSVTIPDCVTKLCSGAFYCCTGIKSITVPASVTTIESFVFYGSGITDIYYKGTEEDWGKITIGENAVPDGCVIHYEDDDPVVTVTDISVSTLPAKTEYFLGEELDITGGKITVKDGVHDPVIVDMTADMVDFEDFDNTTAGEQRIYVRYKNSVTVFTVTVKAPSVTGIEITSLPVKTDYFIGEAIDLTGGKGVLKFDHGDPVEFVFTSPVVITAYDSYNISIDGYNGNETGKQTVTVSCGDYSDTFEVNVKPIVVESITVTAPDKTLYMIGEELDTKGCNITVTYSDGSEYISVSLDLAGLTVSGYDSTKAGKQTITVEYQGCKDTFEVEVQPPVPVSIKVTAPDKTVYLIGEELDTKGCNITVTYSNGSGDISIGLDLAGLTVSGYDSTKAGKQTITVEYQGCKDTFNVTVTEPDSSELQDITDSDSNTGNAQIENEDLTELLPEADSNVDQIKLVAKEKETVTDEVVEKAEVAAAAVSENVEAKIYKYIDISIEKYVEGELDGTVTETAKPVVIKLEIPEELKNDGSTLAREFFIIRIHGGVAERLETVSDGTNISFETNKFSDYAIGYIDLEYGDVNGDGTLTMADLLLLKQYMVKVPGKTVHKAAADVTADNDLTMADLLRLKQYMVKVPGVKLGK